MSATVLGIAFFFAIAAQTPAQPPEPPALLLPVTPSPSAAVATKREQRLANISKGRAVLRPRLMRLNRELLSRLLRPAAGGRRFQVELAPGVATTVVLQNAERDRLGFLVYEGYVDGDPLGFFNLVLRDDVAEGSVDMGGRSFRITHVGDDIVAVYEIDQSVFKTEAPPIVPTLERLPILRSPRPPSETGEHTSFNVLIVYTTDARKAAGGILPMQTHLRLAVSQMNLALRNSEDDVSVVLTGFAEVDYTESGHSETDLEWLHSDAKIAHFRSSWDADDVSMIVETMEDNICGRGYIMHELSTDFAAKAFNVVRRDCATDNKSYAHEAAHNMGCEHDHEHAGKGKGIYGYSYGYRVPGDFRTIMAYPCEEDSPCPRILYYSNPDVSYQGQATGIAKGEPDPADNALTISETAPTVARFRTTLPTNTFSAFDHRSNSALAQGIQTLPKYLIDVNLDGRADFCRFLNDASGETYHLSCTLASAAGWDGGEFHSAPEFDTGYPEKAQLMADVNGDGRGDYCRFVDNYPNVYLSCALATSEGRFGSYDFNSVKGFDSGISGWPYFLADVNADSRADYCRFIIDSSGNKIFSCTLADETGFGSKTHNSGPVPQEFDPGYLYRPSFLVDVNHDHRADYCRFVGTAPQIRLSCALATATSFGNYDVNSGIGETNFDPGHDKMPIFMSDVNADGRADYCRFVGDPKYFSCALAAEKRFGNLDVNSPLAYDAGYHYRAQLFADVNADTKADYCRFVGTGDVFFACGLADVSSVIRPIPTSPDR